MPMNQQDSMHRDFSLPPVAPGQRDLPPAQDNASDVVDPTNGNLIQDVPTPLPTSPQP